MISFAVYSSVVQELSIIEDISSVEAAKCSEEMWQFKTFADIMKLREFLDENVITEFLCFDITVNKGIEEIQDIRHRNKETSIVLIADEKMSPISYMKPGIMATSLLLRPFAKTQIRDVMHDIFTNLIDNMQKDDESFVIKYKGENIRIPLRKIFFFEAREKKIFVNTLAKEYAFYDTLDSLAKRLPDFFVRSHKGFIVNKTKIKKVSLSKNQLELEHERYIPLSRTYKKDFK